MKLKQPKRTKAADAVWRIHRELWEASGKKRVPSYEEIGAIAQIPASSVMYGYTRLAQMGVAERRPGGKRSWYVKPYRKQ